MPFTDDMIQHTYNGPAQGLAATTMIATGTTQQDKLNNLNNKVQDKVNTLSGKWESATLESYGDSDSPTLVGVTGGKGKVKDLTGKHTEDRDPNFDAYEVSHPNDPYQNSQSGIAKYERQRQRLANDIKNDPTLAGKLGVRDVTNITNDDIVRAGTREQLLGLYNLIPGEKAAWEPGPLDYYTADKSAIELGSKENPLNIQVERRNTGNIDHFGRPLAEVRNIETKQSTHDALGYDGTEDKNYSADVAIANLKSQGKLTPELEQYLRKSAKYVNTPVVSQGPLTPTKYGEISPAGEEYVNQVKQRLAEEDKNSITGRIANTGKAAAQSFLKSYYDVADMGAEFVNKDLGTDEQKAADVAKITGYDSSFEDKTNKYVKAEIVKMHKDGVTTEGITNVLKAGFSTPEYLGTSLGFVASLVLGGEVTAPAKVLRAAEKGLEVAKATGDVAKIASATEKVNEAKDAYTTSARALDFVTKNTGMIAVSGGMSNEDIHKYAENAGIGVDEVSGAKKAGVFAGNLLLNSLDRFTDLGILKDERFASGLVDVAKGMTTLQLKELGKGLAKIGTGATVSGGKEAGTEYVQEFITQVNQQVGKDTGETIAGAWLKEKNQLDRETSGVLGFTGAQQMHAVSAPINAISGVSEGITTLADKKESVKGTEVKPEVSDEGYTGLTDDERKSLRESVNNFVTNTESIDVPLHEKINTIRDMEEKVLRLDDREPNKEKLNALIKHTKDEVVRGLESAEDIEEFTRVLGSKQGFLDLLEDVVETTNNNFSEPLRINLEKIAGSFGINSDDFSRIRKDMGEVEIEATKSARGYLTQGKALRSILGAVEPDTAKAEELLKRMQGFESSQHKWIDKYDAAVKDYKAQIEEYNADVKKGLNSIAAEPKKYPFKISKNSQFELNAIKLDNGTYAFNEASDKIRDLKEKNINGIKQELEKSKELLQKAKIDPSKTGVQYSPVIDPDSVGDNAIKKAVYKTKRMFDAFKVSGIITSEITSARNKAIVNGNEQIVNRKEYSKDDTVAVMLPVVRTQADFDKARKEIVRQDSQLKKLIKAAQEAGTTIILDPALRETKTKKLPKFKVTSTVDGKKVTKEMSIRDVLAEQLTRYSGKGLEYKSNMGTSPNVFKPASVVEEESKKRQTEKEEKSKVEKLKTVIRDTVYSQFLSGKKISMTQSLTDLFKTKERLDSYLNNRKEKEIAEKEKEIAEFVEKSKEYNRLEKQINRISEEAKEASSIKAQKMYELIEELVNKQMKLDKDLKELDHVKDFADEEIEINEEEVRASKNLLAEYKALKDLGELEDAEELLSTAPKNVINSILENSESVGAKPIIIKNKKYLLNINDIVTKKNSTSLDLLEVEDMFDELETEKAYLPLSSKEYIERAKEFLEQEVVKVSKASKNFDVNQLTMKNSPAYSLLFNKDGGINDTVVMAIQLGLDEYITYKSRNLSPFSKTKEEVAQMVGVLENQLGHNQYEILKDKGVFQKTFNDEVGKAIMSKLGLGRKPGIEEEVYNRLVAEMGQLAMLVAVDQGTLVEDEVKAKEYAQALSEDNSTKKMDKNIPDDVTIGFVKLTTNEEGMLPTDILDVVRDDYKAIHELLSDEDTFRKGPKFLPIPKKNRRYVREQVAKDIAGAKVPKGTNGFVGATKAMDNLIDTEWKVNDELLDVVSKMDQDVLKKWMGYKSEEDMKSMSFEARDAAVSSNRDILNNLEELLNLREDAHRTLWFDWFYSSNGRYMMDSNTINPQTEKQLHRWLVTPSSHILDYNRTNTGRFIDSKGKILDAEVKYAIAQSMGFAVDKKSTNKINELADKLLDMSAEELAEIKHTILVKGEHYEKNGVKVEPEHIGHFLQGMDFLEKALTGDKFSSSLSAEFDAVTSGLGIKLLQMPILRSLDKNKLKAPLGTMWYWLNKVGVFKPKQLGSISSMNDVLDSVGFYGDDKKFYDSYQSLAVDTNIDVSKLEDNAEESIYKKITVPNIKRIYNGIEKVLPKLDADGSVSSALRTLFKDPFMTFNYSAGLRSIRGSLARNMTGKLLNEIAKANPDYKATAEFLAKEGGISVSELIERLREEKASTIMIGKVSIEDILLKTIDSSYGAKVEEIMKSNFGEFMEAHENINNAFKAMFRVFNHKYQKAINAIPSGELTAEKKLEVIDSLREYFPVIKGPLSAELNEGVHVYSTGTVDPKDENARQAAAQTYLKDRVDSKGNKVDSIKANYMIKAFEEAMSAGSVIPVHYIDAAMMAQLTKGKDITAIHDAIIPPLNRAKAKIKDYNKAMVEIGRSYSMIEAMNDMLNRVELTPEEIKELNETKINAKTKNAEGKTVYSKVGIGTNFNDVKTAFSKTAKLVRDGREKLFKEFDNDGVVTGHMTGLEGSMWSNMKEDTKVKEDTIPEVKEAEEAIPDEGC